MHDSTKSAPRTLNILENIIVWLKEQGYKLETLA
jgi:hypothetical protein